MNKQDFILAVQKRLSFSDDELQNSVEIKKLNNLLGESDINFAFVLENCVQGMTPHDIAGMAFKHKKQQFIKKPPTKQQFIVSDIGKMAFEAGVPYFLFQDCQKLGMVSMEKARRLIPTYLFSLENPYMLPDGIGEVTGKARDLWESHMQKMKTGNEEMIRDFNHA